MGLLRKSDTIHSVRNRKNKILEMEVAEPARPVNPKIAAMIAIMKKSTE